MIFWHTSLQLIILKLYKNDSKFLTILYVFFMAFKTFKRVESKWHLQLQVKGCKKRGETSDAQSRTARWSPFDEARLVQSWH